MRMEKTKQCLTALLSGALLAITVLSGCGQSQKAVSKNDDHLTVYLWENRLMKNIVPYIHEQFYDNGIKPYSLDLAEDWSAHEVIQTGAIGEFMSLDGIEWRSSAESASGDIAFDDALWKRIFSETNTFFEGLTFYK